MTYLLSVGIAIDQLINALIGGAPDETLSSRAHRMREKGQPVWGWTADAIDVLFWCQDGHCEQSYQSELQRRQLPREFGAAK